MEDYELKLLALNSELITIKTNAALDSENFAENPLGFILLNAEDPNFREILVKFSNSHIETLDSEKEQWAMCCETLPPIILDAVEIEGDTLMINERSENFVGYFLDNYQL